MRQRRMLVLPPDKGGAHLRPSRRSVGNCDFSYVAPADSGASAGFRNTLSSLVMYAWSAFAWHDASQYYLASEAVFLQKHLLSLLSK